MGGRQDRRRHPKASTCGCSSQRRVGHQCAPRRRPRPQPPQREGPSWTSSCCRCCCSECDRVMCPAVIAGGSAGTTRTLKSGRPPSGWEPDQKEFWPQKQSRRLYPLCDSSNQVVDIRPFVRRERFGVDERGAKARRLNPSQTIICNCRAAPRASFASAVGGSGMLAGSTWAGSRVDDSGVVCPMSNPSGRHELQHPPAPAYTAITPAPRTTPRPLSPIPHTVKLNTVNTVNTINQCSAGPRRTQQRVCERCVR